MFTIKQGDTRYALKAVLKDNEGVPIDLTGCQVKVVIGKMMERTPYIHDALNGEVWVVFQPEDTATPGFYYAEFKITYQDGKVETFPNNGYIKIAVSSSL